MKQLFLIAAIFLLGKINAQVQIEDLRKGKSYQQSINEWNIQLSKFRSAYQHADDEQKLVLLENLGVALEQKLLTETFHYWLGTTWDFNGYTNVPGEGKIACGYFVSTPLKHLGFNINRFKLAQKSALEGSQRLCGKENVIIKYNLEPEELKTYFLKNLESGIYKIGLANHTGFLYFDKHELYFIHSHYGTPYSVVIEKFVSSEVSSSSIYTVAPITRNKDLMHKLITNEFIPIP